MPRQRWAFNRGKNESYYFKLKEGFYLKNKDIYFDYVEEFADYVI